MKKVLAVRMVWVTVPSLAVGRKLSRTALSKKAVACASIVPGLESHYWWKGKIEKSTEWLLLFKTTEKKVRALKKIILAGHPYDTPEFVVLSITSGSKRYLAWLEKSVKTN